jgi:hypothetical protein
MLHSLTPITFVVITVSEFIKTLAIHLIMVKVADVLGAVGPGACTSTMGDSFSPLAFIAIAVSEGKDTSAVLGSLLKLSEVLAPIRLDSHPSSMNLTVEEITLIRLT